MSQELIEYINNTLFYVPALEYILIKASTISIKGINDADYAFKDAKDTLINFSFEENPQIETIAPYCFYQCSKLISADLSYCEKLITISDYAFYECSSL